MLPSLSLSLSSSSRSFVTVHAWVEEWLSNDHIFPHSSRESSSPPNSSTTSSPSLSPSPPPSHASPSQFDFDQWTYHTTSPLRPAPCSCSTGDFIFTVDSRSWRKIGTGMNGSIRGYLYASRYLLSLPSLLFFLPSFLPSCLFLIPPLSLSHVSSSPPLSRLRDLPSRLACRSRYDLCLAGTLLIFLHYPSPSSRLPTLSFAKSSDLSPVSITVNLEHYPESQDTSSPSLSLAEDVVDVVRLVARENQVCAISRWMSGKGIVIVTGDVISSLTS